MITHAKSLFERYNAVLQELRKEIENSSSVNMSNSVWGAICTVGTYAHKIMRKTLGFDDQPSPTADQTVCEAPEVRCGNQILHAEHEVLLPDQHIPEHNQNSGLKQVCEILHPENIQQQPSVIQRYQRWENSNRDASDPAEPRISDLRPSQRVSEHHDEIVNRDRPPLEGREEHNGIPHREVSITRRGTGFLGQSITTVSNMCKSATEAICHRFSLVVEEVRQYVAKLMSRAVGSICVCLCILLFLVNQIRAILIYLLSILTQYL